MTTCDYRAIAEIIGETFAVAYLRGDGGIRDDVYATLYLPMVEYMENENPRFDRLRFSFAVGKAEDSALEKLRRFPQ